MSTTSSFAPADVVLLMVDQLGAKWFEAAVAGAADCPNFRRLLDEGCDFSNAIVSNPVCLPSRSSVATGLTSHGHGVLENAYQLDPSIPTFMRALQAAGWQTAAAGKIHFQPHFRGVPPDYHPHGFDQVHATEDPRAGAWLDWVHDDHPEHFEAALATIWSGDIPELRHYGDDRIDLTERVRERRRRFTWATQQHPMNSSGAHVLPFPEDGSRRTGSPNVQSSCSAIPTAGARSFCRSAMSNLTCRSAAPRTTSRTSTSPLCRHRCRGSGGRNPSPQLLPDDQGTAHPLPGDDQVDDWRWVRTLYFGDLVRPRRAVVRPRPRWQGGTPLRRLHPGPSRDLGTRCRRRHRALGARPTRRPLPTILDIADTSLLGLASGSDPSWSRSTAYSESFNNIWSDEPSDWARTARSHDYRYTIYPALGGEQLFHLTDDPDETHNLIGDPGYHDQWEEMRQRLVQALAMSDYPKSPRNLFAFGAH